MTPLDYETPKPQARKRFSPVAAFGTGVASAFGLVAMLWFPRRTAIADLGVFAIFVGFWTIICSGIFWIGSVNFRRQRATNIIERHVALTMACGAATIAFGWLSAELYALAFGQITEQFLPVLPALFGWPLAAPWIVFRSDKT